MVLFGGVELHPKTGVTTRYHNSIWLLTLPPAASCVRSSWASTVVGNESVAPCSSLSTSPNRWSKHGECVPSNGCTVVAGLRGQECVDICTGQSYYGCPDPGCQWRSVGAYQWREVQLELHKGSCPTTPAPNSQPEASSELRIEGYPFAPSPRAFHTAFVVDGILTIYGGAVVAPGSQDGSWIPGKSTLLLKDDGVWEFRPYWEHMNGVGRVPNFSTPHNSHSAESYRDMGRERRVAEPNAARFAG